MASLSPILATYYSDNSGSVQVIGWAGRNLFDEYRDSIDSFVSGFGLSSNDTDAHAESGEQPQPEIETAVPSQTIADDGKYLLVGCGDYLRHFEDGDPLANPLRAGHCLGRISGALDMALAFAPDSVCIPSSAFNLVDVVRVVTEYLEAHPLETHEPASALALRAVAVAFPCQ